jgi:hypothetical protein
MSKVVLVDPAGQGAQPGPLPPAPATGLAVPFDSFDGDGDPLATVPPGELLAEEEPDAPAGLAVPVRPVVTADPQPASAIPASPIPASPILASPILASPVLASPVLASTVTPTMRAGPAMTLLSSEQPKVGRWPGHRGSAPCFTYFRRVI